MRWILSWFGMWERHRVICHLNGEEFEFAVWLRPWEAAARADFRRGVRALSAAGWLTYHLVDGYAFPDPPGEGR